MLTCRWFPIETPYAKPVALLVNDVRIFAVSDSDRNNIRPLIAFLCGEISEWAAG